MMFAELSGHGNLIQLSIINVISSIYEINMYPLPMRLCIVDAGSEMGSRCPGGDLVLYNPAIGVKTNTA